MREAARDAHVRPGFVQCCAAVLSAMFNDSPYGRGTRSRRSCLPENATAGQWIQEAGSRVKEQAGPQYCLPPCRAYLATQQQQLRTAAIKACSRAALEQCTDMVGPGYSRT